MAASRPDPQGQGASTASACSSCTTTSYVYTMPLTTGQSSGPKSVEPRTASGSPAGPFPRPSGRRERRHDSAADPRSRTASTKPSSHYDRAAVRFVPAALGNGPRPRRSSDGTDAAAGRPVRGGRRPPLGDGQPEAKFGDFAQTEISGHLNTYETTVRTLAAIGQISPNVLHRRPDQPVRRCAGAASGRRRAGSSRSSKRSSVSRFEQWLRLRRSPPATWTRPGHCRRKSGGATTRLVPWPRRSTPSGRWSRCSASA